MHRVLASLRVTKATSSTSKRFEGRRAHVKHLSFHTQICSLSTHNVGCARTYLKRSTNKFFSSTGESTNSGPAEPRKAHELIGLACPCTSPAVMAASLSSRRKRNEGKYIDSCDICYATCLPIGPLKMQLRLAMVDAGRIMHCPIPPTVLDNQPTARSELQSSKLDAGPHGPDSSRSVGPDLETYTLWLPGHFGKAAFMNPSSKHGLGGTAIN